MSLDAFRRIIDTRRRIEEIQQARRAIVIRRQLAAMRASA